MESVHVKEVFPHEMKGIHVPSSFSSKPIFSFCVSAWRKGALSGRFKPRTLLVGGDRGGEAEGLGLDRVPCPLTNSVDAFFSI